MMRPVKIRMTLSLVAAVVMTSLIPPPAGALSRPPDGRYNCYVTYSYPVYTGRAIKVIDNNTYSWFDSKTWRRGAYRYIGAHDVVRFKTGPLKGKTAKHVKYGNGTHGLTLVIRTPSGPSNYACSHT